MIRREDVERLVWPLPVTDLLFVGRASYKVLRQYGIRTIGELVSFGREPLVRLLGKQGGQLYDYAAGLEHSPVTPGWGGPASQVHRQQHHLPPGPGGRGGYPGRGLPAARQRLRPTCGDRA